MRSQSLRLNRNDDIPSNKVRNAYNECIPTAAQHTGATDRCTAADFTAGWLTNVPAKNKKQYVFRKVVKLNSKFTLI